MAEKRVALSIEPRLHASLMRRVAIEDCTPHNVVVAACREWIGEHQRGRVGHGGRRVETRRGGDFGMGTADGPVPFDLKIGVHTYRGVEERAGRLGWTVHTAIIRALQAYLGQPDGEPATPLDAAVCAPATTNTVTEEPTTAEPVLKFTTSPGVDHSVVPPPEPRRQSAEPAAPTDIDSFVALARHHLASILDRSGNVLYSGVETLRPGAVYLLGLNPGGDPTDHILRQQTVGATLAELRTKQENEFLDVSWREKGVRRAAGEARLQRRVRVMLERLGLNPRAVCAANLIFVRSRDAETSDFHRLAPVCWAVHEAILQMVRPRLIISLGTGSVSPYGFLRDQWRPASEQQVPSGHGDWICRAFSAGDCVVAGIPHPGRYAIDRNPAVTSWLRGLL